jgi:hypothetical protein
MKKTYIKPESMVVAINVKANLMENSIPMTLNSASPLESGVDDVDNIILSREVIETPDAWEEW